MNEWFRLTSALELLGWFTLVCLVGCASPDLGISANSVLAPMALQPASQGSLTSTRLVSSEILPKPARNPIIDLPPGSSLRDELDSARGGVLLDFYADWCGPCRQQGKLLHEIEDIALQTDTTVIKINVDSHPDIARALSVQGLPTLVMVKQGQVTHRQTGVATPQRLASWMH